MLQIPKITFTLHRFQSLIKKYLHSLLIIQYKANVNVNLHLLHAYILKLIIMNRCQR